MTNQKLYTTVRRHLLAQMAKSFGANPNREGESICLYRGVSGRKCAVGCLIPDEKYTTKLESKSVLTPEVMKAAGLTQNNISLARDLQRIHDCTPTPEEWKTQLARCAERFNLVVEP